MMDINKHSEIKNFISSFSAAVNNIRLYDISHPQASRYIATAYTVLTDVLRAHPQITILIVEDRLIVDRRPLKSEPSTLKPFLNIISESNVERLTFIYGIEEKEFHTFVLTMALPESQSLRSSAHIKIGRLDLKVRPETLEQGADMSPLQANLVASIADIRDQKYDELKSIYHDMKKKQQQIDLRGVDDLLKAFIKGFSEGINPITLLASLKSSDEYTFTHVVNVCILTMSQAETLGFTGEHLYQIGIASVLHDVGKLYVPDDIINKPGKLTSKEREIIETHSTQGAKYIIGIGTMPKLAVLGALEHHIKFDGSGYPAIKGGWKPNIVSQMIAIADVFDAMRSRRAYSEPKPQEKIVSILKQESGTSFNPTLVKNFLRLISEKRPASPPSPQPS